MNKGGWQGGSRMMLSAALAGVVLFLGFAGAHTKADDDRYGMTPEQFEQFKAEAERMGMTPAQAKRLTDEYAGTPLLYDEEHKVALTYKPSKDGGIQSIHVLSDPQGNERVMFEYGLGEGADDGAITYGTSRPGAPNGVMWKDLNRDGVFDALFILSNRHDILGLEQGYYILLDGEWTRANAENGSSPSVVAAANTTYRFVHASGRWIRQ